MKRFSNSDVLAGDTDEGHYEKIAKKQDFNDRTAQGEEDNGFQDLGVEEAKKPNHGDDEENPRDEVEYGQQITAYGMEMKAGDSLKFERYTGKTLGCFNVWGEPLLTIGPHSGMFFITWCSFIAASVFLTHHPPMSDNKVVFNIFSWLSLAQIVFYLATALKNPGICSARSAEFTNDPSDFNYCSKCKIDRKNGTHHCLECDVCISKYDHHCPWTGKCIGGGNFILFKIFLALTMFWFAFAFVTIAFF